MNIMSLPCTKDERAPLPRETSLNPLPGIWGPSQPELFLTATQYKSYFSSTVALTGGEKGRLFCPSENIWQYLNLWRHFWLSELEGAVGIYGVETRDPTKSLKMHRIIIQTQMSKMLRLRNPILADLLIALQTYHHLNFVLISLHSQEILPPFTGQFNSSKFFNPVSSKKPSLGIPA